MADEMLAFGTLEDLREQISAAVAEYPDPVLKAWMIEQCELNPGRSFVGRHLGGGLAEILFVSGDGREIVLLKFQSLLGPDEG